MDLYVLPNIVRVILAVVYFTGVIRSVSNFNLMSYRWRRMYWRLWMVYFILNLTFNTLMAAGLLVIQIQATSFTHPGVIFDINWLFILPIFSHIIMMISRFLKKHSFQVSQVFILLRVILMILLLPVPGNYLWSVPVFNGLFILFTALWVVMGYYYLFTTRRYLSTHFTDYTKLKAYEVFPHGIVVSSPEGRVLSINPKALDILSNLAGGDDALILDALESYDGLYRNGPDSYRINHYSMVELNHRYNVWELVKVTELIDIQTEIDKNTATIRSAWQIVRNILDQLKASVHLEEQVRLQQYLHDVMGETFSVLSYSLQAMEGREITDDERQRLLHLLSQMYPKLEDRTAGGSDSSFLAMQRSFKRIGLELFFHGEYPINYHHRHLTYQILREASNNSLKHGGATEVHLNMKTNPESYQFTITNNGQLSARHNEEGLGLKGMYRLVQDWQGEIHIDPSDHYRIDVRLPIK